MCRRIITGAAAAAALLVSCAGNARPAARGGEDGSNARETVSVADTVSKTPQGREVPRNREGNPSVSFKGSSYTADIVWRDSVACFSAIFIVKSSASLPIADGSAWSSPERSAGIYFMESIPGAGVSAIKCKYPEVSSAEENTPSLQWNDEYGYRSFRMRMDQEGITVEGYDPGTGQPVDNWFLSLVAAREKSYDLPFTVIVPQRINAMSRHTEYHADIARGTVALNSKDTPQVFHIYPDNGTIVLKPDQKP